MAKFKKTTYLKIEINTDLRTDGLGKNMRVSAIELIPSDGVTVMFKSGKVMIPLEMDKDSMIHSESKIIFDENEEAEKYLIEESLHNVICEATKAI